MLAPLAPSTGHHHIRGIGLVMGAGFCFSLGGLFLRFIEGSDGWNIIFYRSLSFGIAVLCILAWRHRTRFLHAFLDVGWFGVIGGACIATSAICVIWSMLYTTIANTTFIFGALPFLTALLAWGILGERVRFASWLAMIVVLVGIAVMMAGGFAGGRLIGNLLALTGTFALAVLTIVLRGGRRIDMIPTLVYGALFAAIICAVFTPNFAITSHDLFLSVLLGTVTGAGGFGLFTLGARYVKAGEMWILSNVELIFAPLWVWLTVAEVPLVETLVGGGIIMVAILFQAIITARNSPDS